MEEQRVNVRDIPTKLYVPAGADRPLLLGHGGGHSKDGPRFVRLARRYAEELVVAVACIDSVDHGERRPTNATGGIPAGWHSSAISRMVLDWQAVADAFSSIGPAGAYVGFSMGATFGVPVVAAMPSVEAAAFVVGGIPTGWTDDPVLEVRLEEQAALLTHSDIAMLNMTQDEMFAVPGVHRLFDAIRGRTKRLTFWEGNHDEWPDELISESITFLKRSVA